jgi:hypothetical protein
MNVIMKIKTIRILVTAITLTSAPQLLANDAEVTAEGMVRQDSDAAQILYKNPEANFSVYERIAILEPKVAFRTNWQRDQRRSNNRIRTSEMERIQQSVADLFTQVFTERLSADDGYEIVDVAGYDVLVVRAAIINLDVTSPDTFRAGRTRTFSATAGEATLVLELVDSITGQTLARAVDRRTARTAGGRATISNRITNTAEARRMFGSWADALRNGLDQFYPAKKVGKEVAKEAGRTEK